MKRPPQLWVLSIGILSVWVLPSALGLRATSLIFSKTSSTTSTTSTTEASAPGDDESATVSTSESSADNQTATKPPLTGIPQIDYIWDPNLPFEIRGYNLSDYPFYDRVPEEIDFKCDGLHDGFYASVPHKCQVYHHCLFGTRYDFLCANFTAFDQKTFICHFVSEVDCNNSKKFWHRNDALYQAASTTTPSTTTVQAVVTPSPVLNPGLTRPIAPLGRPIRRRKPFRRRPAYDYYYDDLDDYDDRSRPRVRDRDRDRSRDSERDDYYEEPPLRSVGVRRRPRPRPNRRPIEYDEYEEYEDERFDRRPSGRRDEDRRPYRDDDRRYDDRRPTSKNKDRRVEDDDEDKRSDDRRKSSDRRRPSDDRRTEDDYDRRTFDRPRKQARDRYEDDKDEDRRSSDRPRKTDDSKNDRRLYDRPRKQNDDDRRYRPKDQKGASDDKDERSSYDRPRKPVEEERRYRPRDKSEERLRPIEESKPLIKPSGGSSVYDRPRAPPIIRRPVPKNDREKFDYKPTASVINSSPKPVLEDEEYYEDYEDEPKSSSPKPTRKSNIDSEERRGSFSRPRRPQVISTRRPVENVDDRKQTSKRNQSRGQERFQDRGRFDSERNNKKPPVEEEYSDEYEEDKSSLKGESSRERERSSEKTKLTLKESQEPSAGKTGTTSEENISRERERRVEPIVKIVKRPFLPSRGGNPYSARGLQPVGAKALEAITETIIKPVESITEKPQTSRESHDEDSSSESKQQSEEEVYYEDEEDLKPVTKRPQGDFRPFRNDQGRTTQKPKVPDNYRNPLDINENEYDVTLNDALNPTLPNLPVRSVPTGFSTGRDGYLSQNYQRPRLISVETPVLTPANSDYVYVKQPTARYNPYVAVQLNRQPYTTYQ